MDYTFQFGDVFAQFDVLLDGAWLTLWLSGVSMAVGLVIAVVLAGLIGRGRPARLTITAYVEIIRNTPFITQVLFVYFALPSIGIRFSPVQSSLLTMIVYVSAYSTEIVRAGIESVPAGQVDAARSLGLRSVHILRFITIPNALQVVYPALTSQFILIMLSSSILSVISTQELSGAAIYLDSITFRSLEVYLSVFALYFAISASFYAVFYLISRLAFSPLPGARPTP
jgi:polar amino acid transport system permease protein